MFTISLSLYLADSTFSRWLRIGPFGWCAAGSGKGQLPSERRKQATCTVAVGFPAIPSWRSRPRTLVAVT